MEVDILIKRARRKIALKKKEEQKQLIEGEIGKVDNKVSEVAQGVNRALEVATEALETAKSSKSEKGEPGYTPIKGKDYFDGKDGKPGKDGYTPIKGKDYFDGKPGKPGKDGKDGKSIKGEPGKDGKDGSPDTPYEIRDKLSSLKGRERLDAKAIKNLNKEISLVVSGISAPSTESGSGEGGVTAHSDLTQLDYASSGHTGFAPAGSYLTEETDPVFTAWDKDYGDLINKPSIPDDVSDLTDTTGLLGDASKIQGFDVTTTDPTDGKILVYRTASSAYVLEDKPAAGANPAAADVSFVPAGNIAATNVQDALQEVDNEKIATAIAIAFAVAL